jgi:predicted alpha/beta-fold hydrolase
MSSHVNDSGGGTPPSYRAPWWLPGGHVQTVYASLVSPKEKVTYRRERWDTTPNGQPDGDFIDVDIVDGNAGSPVVLHFHGLEGSSQSQYALGFMARCKRLGWTGMVANFRGCSGEPNRLARAYHSGDATEIDWIVKKTAALYPDAALYTIGVSLGGNAMLKWLGERGAEATRYVKASAAVSAPVDLMAAGEALGRGFSLNYARHFLDTMKRKATLMYERHPGSFDIEKMRIARNLREYDNVVTAPLHGYRDTDDYWTRASSKPGLANVAVPALVLNAINDPFLPAEALPTQAQVSEHVILDQPKQGGHVGWPASAFPGRTHWLTDRVFHFFQHGT